MISDELTKAESLCGVSIRYLQIRMERRNKKKSVDESESGSGRESESGRESDVVSKSERGQESEF